jgi:hypothetical protein
VRQKGPAANKEEEEAWSCRGAKGGQVRGTSDVFVKWRLSVEKGWVREVVKDGW